MDEKCEDCKFYADTYCVRYPPKPKDGFPNVGFAAWCGEFKPVPKKKSGMVISHLEPGEDATAPLKSFPL